MYKSSLHRFSQRIVLTISLLCTYAVADAQINTDRMMLIGRNAMYYDDFALSIQYFNQVINAKPHLHEPYFYRGLAKFYLEDYIGAENDCGKAIEINPYYSNSYEVRGLARIKQEKYLLAAQDYEEATKLEYENKNIWNNLILCYLQIDSIRQAHEAVDVFIQRWPKNADGYTMRSDVMLKENDTISAEQQVDTALILDKYNNVALSMKASFLMNRDAFADAESYLNESLRLQPNNTHNLINRAMSRYHQDNYRGAMNDYDLALQIDSTNFIGHYNRGLLLAAVGEDNKAIEDFNYILSIDPDDVMTLFNRARLLDQTGDYKGAIRDYTTVIKEFPKFLYGYQLRAQARRKIGDVKGAMQDEEHILRENVAHKYGYSTPTSRLQNKTRKKSEIDPADYEQLIEEEEDVRQYNDEYRGKIQNKSAEIRLLPIIVLAENSFDNEEGKLSEYMIDAYRLDKSVVDKFREGIDCCINADDVRYSTEEKLHSGQFSLANAQYVKAADAFSEVISRAPQFAEAYYNRAFILAMQGDYEAARKDLDIAIKRKNNFAQAYFNRGIVYAFMNDKQKSIEDLSKAGELGIFSAYSIIKQQQKKK